MKNDQPSLGRAIELIANGMIEDRHVGHARILRDPDIVGERSQCAGSNAAPPQSGDRDHPRIVPAIDQLLVNQLDQLSLAHHRISKIESGEFVLMRKRRRQFQRLQNPVVKRAVHFELERANRMSDAFDIIAQGMGPVVHRINGPFVSGMVMRGVADAIEHGIAQPDIGRVDIDLCS